MNTKKSQSAWFVLADNHRAKLLQCNATATGHCHIEPQEATEYQWEGHEHGRPMPLASKNGHSYASAHHDAEEQERRFARQIVQWLQGAVREKEVDRLTVFSPPRMLGLLRDIHTDRLSEWLELCEADLVNLPNEALREHPAILRLIGLAPVD